MWYVIACSSDTNKQIDKNKFSLLLAIYWTNNYWFVALHSTAHYAIRNNTS